MTSLYLFPQDCPQPWEHPYTSHWYGQLVCLTCVKNRDKEEVTQDVQARLEGEPHE